MGEYDFAPQDQALAVEDEIIAHKACHIARGCQLANHDPSSRAVKIADQRIEIDRGFEFSMAIAGEDMYTETSKGCLVAPPHLRLGA